MFINSIMSTFLKDLVVYAAKSFFMKKGGANKGQ